MATYIPPSIRQYESSTTYQRPKTTPTKINSNYDVPGILPTNLGFGDYADPATPYRNVGGRLEGGPVSRPGGLDPPIPIKYGSPGTIPSPTGLTPPPYTQQPRGPGGGGGGGGGGGATLSQDALNQLLALLGRRPDQLGFTPFQHQAYQARPFYNFDDSRYRAAEQTLGQEIGAARGVVGQEMQGMRDYYGGLGNVFASALYAQNPSTRAAMERMMGANSVNPNVTTPTEQQGRAGDMGFASLMGLMAANEQRRKQDLITSTMAEERRLGQSLDRDQRMLGLQGRLAEAGARGAYDQARFGYETEADRYSYETAMQQALQNWQQQNAVNQANVQGVNDWRAGLASPILQLMQQYPALNYAGVGGLG